MIKNLLSGLLLVLIYSITVKAQNNATVFNPAETTRYLSSSDPRPAIPANDNNVYSWYATKKMSWDASSFKAYIFNGMVFRLKYPKNYDPANTIKKYPLTLYFAGAGEGGSVYDNEQQIVYAQSHMLAVDNLTYDGFLLFPESTNGFWIDSYYDKIAPLLNIITSNTNADVNRIIIEGYSSGGIGVVEMLRKYPKLFAAALPMSVVNGWRDYANYAEIPEWVFQGAVDTNPDPYNTDRAVNSLLALGANIKYTKYPNVGHGTWGDSYAYGEADFYPYMLRANKANPIAYFGRTEFCNGETPNVKLGLTAGFDSYEWKKGSTIIPNANSNTLQVNDFGTYYARIKRGNVWSDWSPGPIVIKTKAATVSPTITVFGLASKVLPASDTTKVTLQVPTGFAEYEWRKQDGTQILGTTNKITVSDPGNYVVKVKEQYGCASAFSSPFNVVNANGSNKPNSAFNITVSPLSKTQLLLNWSDNTNPAYNETGFEIYRSIKSGSGYKYVGRVGADILKYQDNNLTSNTKYYYVIRAVNESSASSLSAESYANTIADNVLPSVPKKLSILSTTRTYADLVWESSTDDVGVKSYNIYVNDILSYSVLGTSTSFRVSNLDYKKNYTFRIIAKDLSNNSSLSSNQVSTIAVNKGFSYKYYENNTGSIWSLIPNFNQLTPTKTGQISNINLSGISPRADNFGVIYEGYINIPVKGNYTFVNTSDDGSNFYLSAYNPTSTPTINNDGSHASTSKEVVVALEKAVYPFTVTYKGETGNNTLSLFWKNTATGVGATAQAIPDSVFADTFTNPILPIAPSQVTATSKGYDQIQINWSDNSADETGFEIYRSETSNGSYSIAGKVLANITSYIDTKLAANKAYYYKIRSISLKGESAFGIVANASTTALPPLPSTPANFNVSSTSSSKIRLQWSPINNVEYAIYRSVNDNTSYVKIFQDSLKSGIYIDDGLYSTTSYFYKIKAVNSAGESSFTQEISFSPSTVVSNQVLLVNFHSNYDNTVMAGLPWNSFNAQISANTVLSNIKDSNLNPTGVRLTLLTSWAGHGVWGSSTGNNSGIYPDNVLKTYYYNNTDAAMQVKVSGLDVAKLYAFTFYGNWSDPTPSSVTNYTIGTKTVSLETIKNLSNTVQIRDISPDGNGEVIISVKRAAGAPYAFLNAMIIQSQGAVGSLPAPDSLMAVTKSQSSIQLSWKDRSSDETGFEISRSLSETGTYTVVTTTAANATSYIDNGLTANTKYWYKIRATGSTGNSDYTAAVAASTVVSNQVLLVNFHSNYDNTVMAGLPWNSFNAQISANTVLSNIKDSNLNPTGVRLTLLTSWAGHGVWGSSTGNNSGIYPDNVLKTYYYNNTDAAMQVKVSGLDVAKLYAFTFYGNWSDPTPSSVTNYTIGTKTVSLETIKNLSNTVQIRDISPDGNGEVIISVKRAAGAPYAFLNAMIIQSQGAVGSLPAPDSLMAVTKSQSSIQLSWKDRSSDETGFEISRSLSETGTYTVVTTTAANATSYIDNGLTANTKYWYKIRATGSTGNSDYTAAVAASTVVSNQVLLVNFHSNYDNTVMAGLPWNSFNAQISANTVLSNIKDSNLNPTGVRLTLLTSWAGHGVWGSSTGNNSGIYPDNVLKTYYYNNTDAAMQVKVSGLDVAKLYAFTFYGNWSDPTPSSVTNYTIGTKTVSLETIKNLSNTVQIRDISPDGNGEVIISVKRAAGAPYAFLNAMIIQSQGAVGSLPAPDSLMAVTKSQSSIQLSWKDRSSDETGFEISRSLSETGTYTVVTTTAANATSYIDNGLTANTKYWYKIRATGSTGNSDYTAAVAASTFTYSVLVNFTREEPALSPWNNTNKSPEDGDRFPNLVSTDNVNTGIIMTIPDNFSGANSLGVVTGNNSGKYPDAVSKWAYYSEKNETAKIRFSGLNTAYSYDFEFFNSWNNPFAVAITNFTINGVTVSLDPAYNTTNTAVISNINPDQYGEITIDVFMPDGSSYAWLNALTLNAHPLIGTRPPLVAFAKNAIGYGKTGLSSSETNAATEIKAYPNPFVSRIFVNLDATYQQAKSLRTDLVDQSGRVISTEKSQAGQKFIEMDVQKFNLLPGMYFIRLSGEGVQTKTFKMMKQ